MSLWQRTVVGMCVGVALASAKTGWGSLLTWTFQRVDAASPPSYPMLSAAMRTGATWPVVLADSPSGYPNQLMSFSLTPAGWMRSWVGGTSNGSYVRSEVGPDGRIGAAWANSYTVQFAQFTSSGWQSSQVATLSSSPPSSAPDVDYLSGNRPTVAWADQNTLRVAVYDGLVWNTDTVDFAGSVSDMGTYATMAIDSHDGIGVAYVSGSDVNFAFRTLYGGSWIGSAVSRSGGSVKQLSLAFGPNDEAGLSILRTSGVLDFAAFNTQTGTWQTTPIASGLTNGRVNVVYDSQGSPAVAYVAGSAVHYQINDGGGWQDYVLPTGLDPDSGLQVTPGPYTTDTALAFDRNNLPVIAHYAGSSGLLLAYDPHVIPEPTSLFLLGAGLVLVRRFGRRA